MATEVVADAAALFSMLNGGPGSERVEDALPRMTVSTLALAGLGRRLRDTGMPAALVAEVLANLSLTGTPFDADQCAACIALDGRAATLPLESQAALVLARDRLAPILTAEAATSEAAQELDLASELLV